MPSSSPIRPPLTKQSRLWQPERDEHAIACVKDRQNTNAEPSHRFIITDPLLKMLLLPVESAPDGWPMIEPWSNGKHKSGALLTWFVQQALGLKRLPFCEDRLLTEIENRFQPKELVQIVNALTPAQVEATTKDVLALYQHTQTQLKKKALTEVSLRRTIADKVDTSYWCNRETTAGVFSRLRLAAYALDQSTIQLNMDTLNSWGDDGCYSQNPVELYALIPAHDILYAAELVEQPQKQEAGEWVAINRSCNGVVEFAVTNVEVPSLTLDQPTVQANFPNNSAQEFWGKYQPLVFRTGQSSGTERFQQAGWSMPVSAKRAVPFWKRLFCGR